MPFDTPPFADPVPVAGSVFGMGGGMGRSEATGATGAADAAGAGESRFTTGPTLHRAPVPDAGLP